MKADEVTSPGTEPPPTRDRGLVFALGLLAALPILVAMGYAIGDEWTPIGDDAYIAIRAHDVFTDLSPLVGQRSSGASGVLEETAYSPGPLLFWLLALPARMPDGVFMTLTTGVINVAAVVGSVALARRRGGRGLMVATAVAIPIMLASLPSETYSDVWNSSAPLMPLLLLVFLAWSVACGEYRLLPLTILVASFAMQSHLTFLPPALLLSVVALGGAALFGRFRGWDWRWMAASLVVLVFCWSAPVIDQLTNEPGNFTVLADSASSEEPELGASAGRRAAARTVGVVPWWLREDQDTLQRIGDLTRGPGWFTVLSACLLLAGLVAVTAIGALRRRADVFAAGAIGLALSVAIYLAASNTPENSVATVTYTLRWASPAGMAVWLLAGWSVATLAPVPSFAPLRGRRPAAAVAIGLAALVAIPVAAAENPPRGEPYEGMRAVIDQIEDQVPADGGTGIESSASAPTFAMGLEMQVGVVYWLRRSGRQAVTPAAVADRLTPEYARGTRRRVLHLAVDVPPPPGGRTIADVQALDPLDNERKRRVIVTLRETEAAAAP